MNVNTDNAILLSNAAEKSRILKQCRQNNVTVTALRIQVLDIVLRMTGVIKAYQVLSQMQQDNNNTVAPPTAYRTLDFWAEHGVLHKIPAVNGYILCRHVQHECNSHCHNTGAHHSAFILVCTGCGRVDEQSMSQEWVALRQRLADSGFSLNEEHIVLTGLCRHCQQPLSAGIGSNH
ncbi:Fur family transcriptional regulator [Neisseriaceae bacterium ESL0693]|nr:Fur family transcriptional regulator [Neisseriaceae bacterium ESL0693]